MDTTKITPEATMQFLNDLKKMVPCATDYLDYAIGCVQEKALAEENVPINIGWIEAHGYPYKIVDGRVYWQTNYQTLSETIDGEDFQCRPLDYFDTI